MHDAELLHVTHEKLRAREGTGVPGGGFVVVIAGVVVLAEVVALGVVVVTASRCRPALRFGFTGGLAGAALVAAGAAFFGSKDGSWYSAALDTAKPAVASCRPPGQRVFPVHPRRRFRIPK